MTRERQELSRRGRWILAWSIRAALLAIAAAAAVVAYSILESVWMAVAVGCFTALNVWSIYLVMKYRAPGPAGIPPDGSDTRPGASEPDEQVARRAAYQKVVRDLFPLASRPDLLSKPFAGAGGAWRRSGRHPSRAPDVEEKPTSP